MNEQTNKHKLLDHDFYHQFALFKSMDVNNTLKTSPDIGTPNTLQFLHSTHD